MKYNSMPRAELIAELQAWEQKFDERVKQKLVSRNKEIDENLESTREELKRVFTQNVKEYLITTFEYIENCGLTTTSSRQPSSISQHRRATLASLLTKAGILQGRRSEFSFEQVVYTTPFNNEQIKEIIRILKELPDEKR